MSAFPRLHVLFVSVVSVLLSVSMNATAEETPPERGGIVESTKAGVLPEQRLSPPLSAESGGEIPGWVARWELARVLSYAKKYDESILEYRKLLREKPSLSKARIELANVLFWNGDREEALRVLERVGPEGLDEDARLLMADIYRTRKDYDKAEPLYRSYLEKHPNDLAAKLRLAEMLSWTQQYEASLNLYEEILAARPDDVQVRRKYAFVLIWSGRQEEAARELKRTLD